MEIKEKILVIGPAWVGDMVMAQTLFQTIKRPDVQIDVLAPAYTCPLLERMPEVTEAIPITMKHGELKLLERFKIGRELSQRGYTQAIVLPNSFKSALIPFFARIPIRTGWRGEWRYFLLNDVRILDKQKLPLMIERFMALGLPKDAILKKSYPKPKFVVDHETLKTTLSKYQLATEQPILGLCPGAEFGPSKRWPAKYYADVANHYIEQGWQVWLFGSKKDETVTNEIMEHSQNRCVNLAGKTSLSEAMDLLSCSKVVVTNDSGLMHVSAALGRPLVAVYGSSSPEFTPPLSDQAEILSLKLSCSPCFKRDCPLGHRNCMKNLKPEVVIEAIERLKNETT